MSVQRTRDPANSAVAVDAWTKEGNGVVAIVGDGGRSLVGLLVADQTVAPGSAARFWNDNLAFDQARNSWAVAAPTIAEALRRSARSDTTSFSSFRFQHAAHPDKQTGPMLNGTARGAQPGRMLPKPPHCSWLYRRRRFHDKSVALQGFTGSAGSPGGSTGFVLFCQVRWDEPCGGLKNPGRTYSNGEAGIERCAGAKRCARPRAPSQRLWARPIW